MSEEIWIPALEEYPAPVSVEQWKSFLQNNEIVSENALLFFKRLYKAGEASCSELSERYGETITFYNNNNWQTGKKIYELTKCPLSQREDETERFWSICCLGKNQSKGKLGSWVFKLRPELRQAMEELGMTEERKYWSGGIFWVCGFNFGGDNSQYDRFIKESIWIGGFDERKDKKQIEDCKKVKPGDSIILKTSYTSGENHSISTIKVFAIGIVKSIREEEKYEEGKIRFTFDVDYTTIEPNKEFKNCSYRKTIEQIRNDELRKFVNNFLGIQGETMENINKIDEYVQLLKSNHNIILHGAPGTGKTHLANEIALKLIFPTEQELTFENMNEEQEKRFNEQYSFVQFHPSYDYTDFVEGLRPKNGDDGQIGFERMDGVFKEFCKKAIESIDNGNSKIDNFDEAWEKLIDSVRNEIAENRLLKIGKWEYGLSQAESLKYSSVDSPSKYTFTITKENIYAAHQHKKARPSGNFQKDMEDIVQYMKDKFGLKDYVAPQISTVNSQLSIPFVFIIDEINRGEISKIFGELFFSIDPGYRGKRGAVKTQYASMINNANEFDAVLQKEKNDYGWFFVPENVYIIGTMNDIDRSVESMDFAMRRRFAFHKVSALSTQNMLDNPKAWEDMCEGAKQPESEVLQEIKNRMNNLNYAIWHKQSEAEKNNETNGIEGFSDDFHIGAAYFLKYALYANEENPFKQLWKNHLEILLKEYLRGTGNEEKIKILEEAYNNDVEDKTKVELLKDEEQ